MNINILRYSLFGVAGGQEVDRNFFKCFKLLIMPKVKTTYAYKIQSIVKEFLDEFMESINNQLYCNLCNCAVSCNKRFLLILIELRRNIKFASAFKEQ